TWQYPAFPRPSGVTLAQVHADTYQQELGPPVFDGLRGAGTMVGTVVVGQRVTHHEYVFFTADGGTHWSLADPPVRNTLWVVVADATHWWSGNRISTVFTTDAGAHWTTIPSNLALSFDRGLPSNIQFASPLYGWALSTSSSGSHELLQTSDGGR